MKGRQISAWRRLSPRIYFALLLIPFYSTLAELPSGEKSVDRRLVLCIGSLEVSEYAVEKNARMLEQPNNIFGTSQVTNHDWLKLYLARQVIIAEALARGYDQRPEVTRIVGAMERHMLSSPEGSFYAAMIPADELSEQNLRMLYARSAVLLDLTGVVLPTEKVPTALGADWALAGTPERLRRLEALTSREDAPSFSGRLRWPFGPFAAAEKALATAAVPGWVQYDDDGATVIADVRSSETTALPPFESARPDFEKYIRFKKAAMIQNKKAEELLRTCKFSLEDKNVTLLVETLRSVPSTLITIPADCCSAIADRQLASYDDDGRTAKVSVMVWCDFFNSLFMKKIPRISSETVESLRSLVQEELGCREARRQGLDQAPQFAEDRRNFRYYQALDLFEKEILQPQIVVSSEEIGATYQDHAEKYRRPWRAKGSLLHFASSDDALSWLNFHTMGTAADNSRRSPDPRSSEPCVVSSDHPAPGLEAQTDTILFMPDGRPLGPFPSGQGAIVFLKETTELRVAPLESVRAEIVERMTRNKLDTLELELAKKWAPRFRLEDHFPYEAYRMDKAAVAAW